MTKIFITGATGFVGTAVTKELIAHGYDVVGLARSDESEKKLEEMGASSVRGELSDFDVLKKAATSSDGVIHLGMNSDVSKLVESFELEEQIMDVLGSALEGSNKPLIFTNGLLPFALPMGAEPLDESTRKQSLDPFTGKRLENELYTLGLKDKGVRAMSIRLAPTVHGEGDHGLVPFFKQCYEKKGSAGYIGKGDNVWAAVHKVDAAKLYRLAFEKGEAGDAYHAVAELVQFKDIAGALGKKYNWEPNSLSEEEIVGYFGPLGHFTSFNTPAKTEYTREKLGWAPSGITLAEDIAANY